MKFTLPTITAIAENPYRWHLLSYRNCVYVGTERKVYPRPQPDLSHIGFEGIIHMKEECPYRHLGKIHLRVKS